MDPLCVAEFSLSGPHGKVYGTSFSKPAMGPSFAIVFFSEPRPPHLSHFELGFAQERVQVTLGRVVVVHVEVQRTTQEVSNLGMRAAILGMEGGEQMQGTSG